jgi:hypothetical protein
MDDFSAPAGHRQIFLDDRVAVKQNASRSGFQALRPSLCILRYAGKHGQSEWFGL